MKRTDIKAGEWYAFSDKPRSNWRNTFRVWVIGEYDIYPGTWDWAVTEAEAAGDGAEVRTFTPPPGFDTPIHAPARLFRKAYGKRAWVVAKWVTGRTEWEYAKNEDGTYVLDDDGDPVEVVTPIPDQWQVMICRSDQIVRTWTDHERAEVARKQREAESAAAQAEAARQRIAERAVIVDTLAGYGITLSDVYTSSYELERWLEGRHSSATDRAVEYLLVAARTAYAKGRDDADMPKLRALFDQPDPFVDDEPIIAAI